MFHVEHGQTHLAGGVSRQEKLGKGGRDVRSNSETFRWNPVGNRSHPVELRRQPEASLAWGGAIRTAKRRQRVPRPCYRASKERQSRGSPCRHSSGGRVVAPNCWPGV